MLIGADKWPEAEEQWKQFFTVENSSKMKEEFLEYGGFGLFHPMGEDESVWYDQMVQGPVKTLTHSLYGLGFQIGYLAAKHDLDGIIKRNAPELGRSMRTSIQILAAGWWNGAYDTQTTADGQTYFSATHTYLRGGGTWSNRNSTDAALGHAALESALVAFRKQKNFEGNPQPIPATRLQIPPDLEPISFELLQSRQRHDTTTHAESFVHNKLTTVSWPFLTISTAWAVLAPQNYMKVYWLWNIKPETSHGFNFDRASSKTKTLFACSFGAPDARGSFGSKGA